MLKFKSLIVLMLSVVFVTQLVATGSTAAIVSTYLLWDVGSNPAPTPVPEPELDLTNTIWSVTERADATLCGEGINTYRYSITILTHTNNAIAVRTNAGDFMGNISGKILTWSGTYAEDGGMTGATVTLTLNSDDSRLSGSSVWSWSDGYEACSGTSQVSATRN